VLGDVVREAARRFADTPAYVTEDGNTLTYAELDRLSDEVAVGLQNRGLTHGDVVALLMGSGPGYIVAYVSAAKIGAVTAGINERLSPPEQGACLTVAGPALVIAGDDGAAAIASGASCATGASGAAGPADVVVASPFGPAETLLDELRVVGATTAPLTEDPERPVAIVFTSGTTGLPKGAVFCDRQLDAISEADGGKRFGSGGRGLGSTSMAHLGTMTKLPQTLRGGGTTFLMNRWSAAEALRMVERHGITTLGGIPTQIALMLRHENFAKTDISSVRVISLGGGPSTPALVRETRDKFGSPVLVRYTCTEAGIGTGTNPADPLEDAEESVGRPRPGVEVTIRKPGHVSGAGLDGSTDSGGPIDADGPVDPGRTARLPTGEARLLTGEARLLTGEARLPDGEVGEVCLGSDAVMAGYFKDPVATAAVMTKDGAVRTGDLGWLDDQGRLHLCGRAKEMYVRGGYNVFPLEVEAVLCEHPAVAHVAIAPRPDPVMGEIGVAVVVLRDGASPPALEDLRRHAEGRLAHHKMPEQMIVVDNLPRTAMEKVDRRELQKLVTDATA
jgi:acyl-CoA synthetase (AMP-forming)/AMP-acid ligase II